MLMEGISKPERARLFLQFITNQHAPHQPPNTTSNTAVSTDDRPSRQAQLQLLAPQPQPVNFDSLALAGLTCVSASAEAGRIVCTFPVTKQVIQTLMNCFT